MTTNTEALEREAQRLYGGAVHTASSGKVELRPIEYREQLKKAFMHGVRAALATLPAEGTHSLLHRPVKSIKEISDAIPGGCYCPPDRCGAPVIMGRQTPCLRNVAPATPAKPLPQARPAPSWQPIETAPQDGYVLVHEDGAIRALMRINGVWHKTGYPAIISHLWGDVIVGDDTKRFLPPGYRLELRDGCCEEPTHWMPLPAAPVHEEKKA